MRLDSKIHLWFVGMRHAVATEISLWLPHDHVSQGVPNGVVCGDESSSSGEREGGGEGRSTFIAENKGSGVLGGSMMLLRVKQGERGEGGEEPGSPLQRGQS